jgi:hypothetical protein
MGRPAEPLLNRFYRYTFRPSRAECWRWVGAYGKGGYGKLQVCGADSPTRSSRTIVATWVSWFLHHGSWPTSGQMVLHTCDNPACVNPAHLLLGDHKANMSDMVSKGRSAGSRGTSRGGPKSPERAHKAKLTWAEVGLIRDEFASGKFTKAALGRLHRVDECTIIDIVKRRTWKT